jgi:putative endonuclease
MLAALRAKLSAAHGAAAEQRAEAYLIQQGLKALTRNWRCKTGELDVVMADADTLVIVEVRARSQQGFGGAAASVDARKQQKLARTALAWVQAHPQWQDAPIRFDVVTFEADGQGRWLQAAFDCPAWT